jgi:hypothetical protein
MKRKAPLRTILGQSEILAGVDYFSIFRKTGSGNFVGAATTEGKQPPISHLRNRLRTIKRYLQALLTKSEIELKLSQCKIQ